VENTCEPPPTKYIIWLLRAPSGGYPSIRSERRFIETFPSLSAPSQFSFRNLVPFFALPFFPPESATSSSLVTVFFIPFSIFSSANLDPLSKRTSFFPYLSLFPKGKGISFWFFRFPTRLFSIFLLWRCSFVRRNFLFALSPQSRPLTEPLPPPRPPPSIRPCPETPCH